MEAARVNNSDYRTGASNVGRTGKERPILFQGAMVRALLAGTKTQTRRIVKGEALNWLGEELFTPEFVAHRDNGMCPYGFAGDRLWVRETWRYADWTEDGYPWIEYRADGAEELVERGIPEDWSDRLNGIWEDLSHPENFNIDQRAADRKWRPGIHMPRWACRIVPEVTGVRVERLQDISEEDAQAEGCEKAVEATADDERLKIECGYFPPSGYEHGYRLLWDSINGKTHPWQSNPWVWVVSFKRIALWQPRPNKKEPVSSPSLGGENT